MSAPTRQSIAEKYRRYPFSGEPNPVAATATMYAPLSARPRSRTLRRREGSGVEAISVPAVPTSVVAEPGLVAGSPASGVAWPVSVAGAATMTGDITGDAGSLMALV